MGILDKSGILKSVSANNPICLELGCGNNKRHLEAFSIDALDYPSVDLVGDIFEVLGSLPDSCVRTVYSSHFIEHIEDLDRLMNELGRVVMPNGRLDFIAPHFSNPFFYSDPTHKKFFGLYTFSYFTPITPFRRKVPTYGKEIPFKVLDVQLHFKSDMVFPVRYAIRRLLGALFNATIYTREFYEENLSTIFPCYEVRYKLSRL